MNPTNTLTGWSQQVDAALEEALQKQDGASRERLAKATAAHSQRSGGGPLVTRPPVKRPKR